MGRFIPAAYRKFLLNALGTPIAGRICAHLIVNWRRGAPENRIGLWPRSPLANGHRPVTCVGFDVTHFVSADYDRRNEVAPY